MNHTVKRLLAHRATPWVALAAALLLIVWATAVSAQRGGPDAEDPQLAESRALANELGTRLKAASTEALGRGGPAAAIEVCADVAPALAAELSRRSGAKVARTSLKLRNPANAPDSWATDVLGQFATALRAGEPAATMEFFDRDSGEARYMRPIVAEGVCLVCHGATLAPDVAAALTARYPHDRATGYAAGDLRGAFVVAWPPPN